jgi:nitroimidazol reductase NimA-like FMN-containing flavoprotein (pyridoxamine 5'-phosphate oxidase superfamily)
MTQRHVEQLSPAACSDLLKQVTVGHIVFVDEKGPVALPVNYGLATEQIVFRVESKNSLRALLDKPVAFEVDQIDPDSGSGWSVLVRGSAKEVPIEEVPALVSLMKETSPRPWAEGVHNVWVVIEPGEVTGRMLTDEFVSTL